MPPPGDLASLHGAAEAEVSAPVAGGAGPRDHGAVDMSTATEHAALGGDPDHAIPEPSRRVPRSQGAGPSGFSKDAGEDAIAGARRRPPDPGSPGRGGCFVAGTSGHGCRYQATGLPGDGTRPP